MKEEVIWSGDFIGIKMPVNTYALYGAARTSGKGGDLLICNKCLREVYGWSCDNCNSTDIELLGPSELAFKKIERRNKKIEIILENND